MAAYTAGWFKFTLSAWAEGNVSALSAEANNPSVTLTSAADTLHVIATAGIARQTRKGWWAVSVPGLGELTWKAGYDFRTGGRFMIIRLNGRTIVRAWPKAGCREIFADFPNMPDVPGYPRWRRWQCR